jgi:lysine 2,3-aminomutase
MSNRDQTLRSIDDLTEAGVVDAALRRGELEAVAARYSVAVTPALARLVDRADPDDPIARQFIPDPRELETQPIERADPIGDGAHSPLEGLVHRYPDRVLLKLVHVCPVYCRFCFRRETVGPGGPAALSEAALAAALAYVRNDARIWEVVLTGGDPMMLSPRRIAAVTRQLAAISHVKVLRWHTRVPVADPARITPELAAALRAADIAVFVAVHANHARELTAEARLAIARLVDAGIPMLGQTVLLKGVNDTPEALEALLRGLVEARVKPYYLHHADLAPGTGHFRTSIAEGQRLVRALRGRISGLCQPTYVLDIPGGAGKVPIGPCYVDELQGLPGRHRIEDPGGSFHTYPPDAS